MGLPKVDPDVASDLDQYLRDIGEGEFESLRKKQASSLAVAVGKERVFADYLTKNLQKMFKGSVPPILKAKKPPKSKTVKRIVNLMVSDLHYQSLLDPRETGVTYGSTEEARRTASVFEQAVNYKTEHRDHTGIICHLLGDIIQGQLHDARDGAPIAQQISAAIHILSQGIKYLSENYSRVVIPCTEGNHGRRKDRHPTRATFQKWDSNERVIYDALRQIAKYSGWTNVEFHMPLTPYYRVSALGHSILGTHGDTVINFGNPYKTINVTNITRQVNNIRADEFSLGLPSTEVVIGGHVHVRSFFTTPSGVYVFTNPALIPPDNFSNSIGSFNSSTGQWIFETTEDYAVGDMRPVTVDFGTDKRSELDSIIVPYRL